MTDTNISFATAEGAGSEPQQDRVRSYWQLVRLRLRYDKVTLFFGMIIVAIVLIALLAPILPLRDPLETSMINRLKPIGHEGFILGTDELGRDMLSRGSLFDTTSISGGDSGPFGGCFTVLFTFATPCNACVGSGLCCTSGRHILTSIA